MASSLREAKGPSGDAALALLVDGSSSLLASFNFEEGLPFEPKPHTTIVQTYCSASSTALAQAY